MKNIKLIFGIFLIWSLFISFNSCNDDTVSSNQNPNIVTSLSGVINNLPLNERNIKGLVVKDTITFVAATDSIGSNNLMNINLTVPPQNTFYNLSNRLLLLGSGVIYTDSNTKGNFIDFFTFNSISGQPTGFVVKANSPNYNTLQEGNFFLTYLYVDRSVDISGSTVNIFNTDTIKYTYTFQFGAGYNKITKRTKTVRTNFTEFEVFSGEPAGANWYYIPDIAYLNDRENINNLNEKKFISNK